MFKDYIIIFIITFIVCLVIGYPYVKLLIKKRCNQTILEYVNIHAQKNNTPTMGGLMFVFTTIIVCLIYCRSYNFLLLLSLCALMGFGLIGFFDDYIKVKFKRNLGLTPLQKIMGQGGLTLIFSCFCYFSNYNIQSYLPFTTTAINFGIWIIPITIFVILSTTNAVNLIDGLDGLASKVSIVYLVAFGLIISICSDKLYYLGNSEISFFEMKNLALGCFALAGSLLAFLIFNNKKAQVFMGDVGSLALGGFISVVGTVSGCWLYIPILGVLYVVTALSVVIQVVYYKKTKKRVFLMAPLHHHFEKLGINEEKIVSIYTIISIIIALVCIYFTM